MKVKLVKVYYSGHYDRNDYYWIDNGVVEDKSEWEDISEDCYKELKRVINIKNKKLFDVEGSYYQYYIIEEVNEPITLIVSDFIEEMRAEEAIEEERRKKYERAAKKRAETMRAKSEERKRKQLEKLKEELGEK